MDTIRYFASLIPGQPLQILRVGRWKHPTHGEIEVTESDLDRMVANFQEDIPLDYRHGSAKSGNDPEMGKAAGWIKGLVRKGGELWAKMEWTQRGAEYVKSGEYRKTSAEFHPDWPNPDTGKRQGPTLLAAALTNRPFVSGMAPALLSRDLDVDENNPIAMEVMDTSDSHGDGDTNHKKEVTEMDVFAELAKSVGVEFEDGLDDAGKLAALKAHYEAASKPPEKEKLLELIEAAGLKLEDKSDNGSLKLDDGTEVTAKDFSTLQGQVIAQDVEIKTIRAEQTVDELIGKKLYPRQREWALEQAVKNPEGLKAYLETVDEETVTRYMESAGSAGHGKDHGKAEDDTASKKLLEAIAEKQEKGEKLSYADAMRAVILEQPDLAEAYNTEQLSVE